MDYLRKFIETAFYCYDIDLTGVILPVKGECLVEEKPFLRTMQRIHRHLSGDSIRLIYRNYIDEWIKCPDRKIDDKNLFYTLIHFCREMMTMDYDGQPAVRFDNLFKWREVIEQTGETLLVCAYVAYYSHLRSDSEKRLDWANVLPSDNRQLRFIFEKEGLIDLHQHLKASTSVFDISWVCLMNHIECRETQFRKIVEKQSEAAELYDAVTLAAIIRMLLYKKLIEASLESEDIHTEVNELIKSGLSFVREDIHFKIDGIRYLASSRQKCYVYDYASPDNGDGMAVFIGERRIISDALNGFIKENDLKVIGEPLPAENQESVEWKNGNDFEFKFDVALAPKVEFELSKDDKIPYYNIEISDLAKSEMKENLLKQYGSLEDGEAAKEEDFIIVDFEQGETRIEGTYVALRNVSEAVRPSFVGLKAGDTLDVNVNEAFTNEADRASMLKVSKEELAGIDPLYKMTVKNVKTFVSAPLNQDTFDKIFGEGNVKSEEEFDAKIAERLAAEYGQESEFRFSKDAKAYLVKKAAISLPEKFLKRWIYVANDGKFTMEDIEKEFDLFLEDYRWQMVRNYLMDKYSVKIEEADLMASAKAFAAYQFAMYGINNVPDDQLESYAKTILSQEKEGRRVLEQVEDTKTLSAVKNVVSLEDTKVSVEKFRELA